MSATSFFVFVDSPKTRTKGEKCLNELNKNDKLLLKIGAEGIPGTERIFEIVSRQSSDRQSLLYQAVVLDKYLLDDPKDAPAKDIKKALQHGGHKDFKNKTSLFKLPFEGRVSVMMNAIAKINLTDDQLYVIGKGSPVVEKYRKDGDKTPEKAGGKTAKSPKSAGKEEDEPSTAIDLPSDTEELLRTLSTNKFDFTAFTESQQETILFALAERRFIQERDYLQVLKMPYPRSDGAEAYSKAIAYIREVLAQNTKGSDHPPSSSGKFGTDTFPYWQRQLKESYTLSKVMYPELTDFIQQKYGEYQSLFMKAFWLEGADRDFVLENFYSEILKLLGKAKGYDPAILRKLKPVEDDPLQSDTAIAMFKSARDAVKNETKRVQKSSKGLVGLKEKSGTFGHKRPRDNEGPARFGQKMFCNICKKTNHNTVDCYSSKKRGGAPRDGGGPAPVPAAQK